MTAPYQCLPPQWAWDSAAAYFARENIQRPVTLDDALIEWRSTTREAFLAVSRLAYRARRLCAAEAVEDAIAGAMREEAA